VVAFPTETVYGLGADAEHEAAVRRIFAIKGRPTGHPLIVHLGHPGELAAWSTEPPPVAQQLAERFWPGPLTMVLRRSARVPDVVTGGLPTVGLRVPDHPVALALLHAFHGGIAAPSANRFGAVSPTTAEHVRQDLGKAVDLILDGGSCEVGLESTIVDLSSGAAAILRPGAVSREELEHVVGRPVPIRENGAVRSPGQLRHHYAPRAKVLVIASEQLAARAAALQARGLRVAACTDQVPCDMPPGVVRIPLPQSPEGIARTLYAALREVDCQGCDVVLVTPPAEAGLGLAIADRLRRAAGGPGGSMPERIHRTRRTHGGGGS
jgi:L-threonylcarbamoyladenylate synthase